MRDRSRHQSEVAIRSQCRSYKRRRLRSGGGGVNDGVLPAALAASKKRDDLRGADATLPPSLAFKVIEHPHTQRSPPAATLLVAVAAGGDFCCKLFPIAFADRLVADSSGSQQILNNKIMVFAHVLELQVTQPNPACIFGIVTGSDLW